MGTFNTIENVATGLYATPKDKFIESRRKIISDMKKEVARLEDIKCTLDVDTHAYSACVKRLEKCKEIIKNCEQAIFVTKTQMNLKTNARFRGL